MNPITELVGTRMQELRLKRSDMPGRLGFRNSSKGLRKLDNFLDTAEPHPTIEKQLPAALELPEATVREAIEETRRLIREAEEATQRAAFRPHLYVVTESSRPSQITICGLVGRHRHKIVELPDDFNNRTPEEQEQLIREGIKESMQRGNGLMMFFGKILHYVLLREYDEAAGDRSVYDTEGMEIAEPGEIRQRAPKNPPMIRLRLR